MKRWHSCLLLDGFTFYVMDQTNILLDYVNRSGTWSPAAERVYPAYHGDHRMIVVCGAIPSHARREFSITDRFRVAEATGFLENLARRRGIGPVMDRSPVHTSGAVRGSSRTTAAGCAPWFPTGWPELNAIELLWNMTDTDRMDLGKPTFRPYRALR